MKLLKALLNLVPISIYYLIESTYIGLIASTLWLFIFNDIQMLIPFQLSFIKLTSIIWVYKLSKIDMLTISMTSLPEENNLQNGKI